MLLATVLSRASSSGVSSLPVKTTTGTSRSAGSACICLEQLEAGHVGQAQVEDAAVERLRRAASRSASRAGADGRDLDVVVAEQLDDALPLDVVVLDDQQPLRVRRDVSLDAVERASRGPSVVAGLTR